MEPLSFSSFFPGNLKHSNRCELPLTHPALLLQIHVVHYNSKYQSYETAQDAQDGLAVLAAFVEVKDYPENTYYSNFISHLANIKYPGQSTTLTGLDIQDMLPENLQHYYSYQGSLTTPPCTENVHWFVLADCVKLSRTQVWKLENSLLDHRNKTIQNDYRRTQPLNHRVVESNFVYLPNQGEGHWASQKKPKSKNYNPPQHATLGSGRLRSPSSNTVKMLKASAVGTWRVF
nr:carbonic anhydrase 6 isoform X1 [Aotus nancymaae]